ncbi:hypothetical protein JHK87_034851 [Glycine soja]|nr:hypothetical protein JHK87_034851 [Glycine soja]
MKEVVSIGRNWKEKVYEGGSPQSKFYYFSSYHKHHPNNCTTTTTHNNKGGFREVKKEKGGFRIFTMVCLALETGSMSIFTSLLTQERLLELFYAMYEKDAKKVAAGWPSWLSKVAGETINGLTPRRADTFEKIDKSVSRPDPFDFRKLDTSVEKLVVDFEGGWNPEIGNYCRKLVEFCSGEAVSELCHNIEGNINVGSFSRLIYDMMLAWERPSYYNEEDTTENVAKEKEERKITLNTTQEQDDIPLFYSHVTDALEMMVSMTHRGACGCGCEANTGDSTSPVLQGDGLQTLTTPWYQFRRDNNLMVQDEVVFYYRLNQGVWEIILRKNIGWDEDQST